MNVSQDVFKSATARSVYRILPLVEQASPEWLQSFWIDAADLCKQLSRSGRAAGAVSRWTGWLECNAFSGNTKGR
ncbi:hypothetical protein OH77DRAFT_1420551 [Trametes cingulata]|nr:hypothetical protein OH77DRAFT_1420551 [Trametes cingulata]